MPKKQSNTRRTRVKELPQKEKKLSAGEMKKVKGGIGALAGAIIGVRSEEKPIASGPKPSSSG